MTKGFRIVAWIAFWLSLVTLIFGDQITALGFLATAIFAQNEALWEALPKWQKLK